MGAPQPTAARSPPGTMEGWVQGAVPTQGYAPSSHPAVQGYAGNAQMLNNALRQHCDQRIVKDQHGGGESEIPEPPAGRHIPEPIELSKRLPGEGNQNLGKAT